jgi:rhomboid protease GluP
MRLRRAPVTFGMMAVTGGVFALQLLGEAALGYDVVLALGAKANELILAGQIWRLVTPVFIHAGIAHIFVNMYSLFALGPPVERFFGTARMLAVYLLSGISGVVFSLAFNAYPSVGASGAIFGLLGALSMFLYMNRGLFGPAGGMQLRQLLLVGALNLLISLSPGIDLWGHVGGLVAGAGCTALFGPKLVPVSVAGVTTTFSDQRPWPEVAPRVVLAMIAVGAAALAAMFLAAQA